MANRADKKVFGSYLLIICVEKKSTFQVGALGQIAFAAGYYAYVGSALNHQLVNRCLRHAKPPSEKKTHWHIDYVLSHENAFLERILAIPSDYREECELAATIKKQAKGMVEKFGCSDCSCSSHLFFFGKKEPSFLKT